MNIEDYTIDTSAFAGLGNAATTASISFSDFANEVSNMVLQLTDNGVTIFDNDGNPVIHYKNYETIWEFLQPFEHVKVVFDNGMQIVDESEVDLYEDSEPASDKEIEELLGIQRGDKVSSL